MQKIGAENRKCKNAAMYILYSLYTLIFFGLLLVSYEYMRDLRVNIFLVFHVKNACGITMPLIKSKPNQNKSYGQL